ncbi:helix-turn-helix domain-containing protein [Marinimicrobium sp. ARAG 43.8]|uniref:helix-turn-helix domain-containing protein n=1 Tax=Marinimicrobium sp. ARAG 43.8 TaxID=3418719 RepID=UPI003CF72342
MQNHLSVEETATRLGVSESFVERMVVKGRLQPTPDGHFRREQVDALASLLERLKGNGVGTLLGLLEQELGERK